MATISLTVRNSGFEVAPAGMFINAWVLLVCLGFLLLLAAAIAHICRDPLLDPIVAHIKAQAQILHPDMKDFRLNLKRVRRTSPFKSSDSTVVRLVKAIIAERKPKENGYIRWVAVLSGDRPLSRYEPGKPWGLQVVRESRVCDSKFEALTALEYLLEGDLMVAGL